MVEEKIIDRIKRCFALSKSKNQHEAEAALAKAMELMLKYKLEMKDLEQDAHELEYIQSFYQLKNKAPWAQDLMSTIARATGGTLILNAQDKKGNYPCLCVVSTRQAAEIVDFTYVQMEKRITWLMDLMWGIYMGEESERTFKQGFGDGIVMALESKLTKQKNYMLGYSDDLRSLVVLEEADLQKAIRQFFPYLGSSGSRKITYGAGYTDGQRAGRFIEVNPGLGTSRTAGQRRLS